MTIAGREIESVWVDEFESLCGEISLPGSGYTEIQWSHNFAVPKPKSNSGASFQLGDLRDFTLDPKIAEAMADWAKAFAKQLELSDAEAQAEAARRDAERAERQRQEDRERMAQVNAAEQARLAAEAQTQKELQDLPTFGMF